MTKIAIIGFGVVGSGVYEVLRTNDTLIAKNAGGEIDIKYILDIRDFSNHEESRLFVNDINVLLDDKEVEIIVETMGGLEPANSFTRRALECGKSVVTSNKELVATYGDELFALAQKNGCKYMYEASVGGGIPIIRPLSKCLLANRIDKIAGILNGTTNYILSRMYADGVSFDEALCEAQEKGYAEKDPTADVEGLDTGKKICILSSMINGKKIRHQDIHTEGITKITSDDTKYASKLGYAIKLIGMCERCDDKFSVVVAPMFVKSDSPLYSIADVFNGIMVRGNMLGDSLFYGKGAGKLATASAVVADVIDIAKNKKESFAAPWVSTSESVLVDYNGINTAMYLCFKADDADKLKSYILDSIIDSKITDGDNGEVLAIIPACKISDIEKMISMAPAKLLSKLMILE